MHFSTSDFALLAILSSLAVQISGQPVTSLELHNKALSRRVVIPKVPKPLRAPDADIPAGGGSRAGGGAGESGPLTSGAIDPGKGTGSLGPSAGKEPSVIEKNGQTIVDNVNQAILKNTPPKTGVPDLFAKDSKYTVTKTPETMDKNDLAPTVLEPPGGAPFKFTNPEGIKYTQYTTKNKGSEDEILKAVISKDEGIFHKPYRVGKYDTLSDADKARMSDQMFQVWKDAPGSKGVDNIKVATALDIKNPESMAMIKTAHEDNKIGTGAGATGTWMPGTPQYNQFMGSDNGRPLGRMLADYHTELGNKKVTQIKSTYEDDGSPNLMFYLGPA